MIPELFCNIIELILCAVGAIFIIPICRLIFWAQTENYFIEIAQKCFEIEKTSMTLFVWIMWISLSIITGRYYEFFFWGVKLYAISIDFIYRMTFYKIVFFLFFFLFFPQSFCGILRPYCFHCTNPWKMRMNTIQVTSIIQQHQPNQQPSGYYNDIYHLRMENSFYTYKNGTKPTTKLTIWMSHFLNP